MPSYLYDLIFGHGTLSTGSIVLRLALVGCSMFAMVHLIRLWGTRYGDNNTLSKSFFLSLVLHCCFGLGWATVYESYPHVPAGSESSPVDTPIEFIETIDSAPTPGTSKLPIWHSGPANNVATLTRESRNATRFESDRPSDLIESPQKNQAPIEQVPRELPQIASQTEETAPDLDRSEFNMAKSAASLPTGVDVPPTEARPEATAGVRPSRASIGSRPADAVEAPIGPAPSRGTATRLAPTLEEGSVMTVPTDEANPDSLPKPQGPASTDTIRRPGSPNPAVVLDPNSDFGPDATPGTGTGVPRRTNRVSRVATRASEAREEISVKPSNIANNSNGSTQSNPVSPADDRMLLGGTTIDPLDNSPQPKLEKAKTRSGPRAPARAPETYQARSSGQRMSSVLKHGGSEESERAVENSLKWLASVQESDGRWSAIRHGGGAVEVAPLGDPQAQRRLDGGKFADTGVTGLVVLSFLGAGYSHEKGPYTSEIRSALDWLMSQQRESGYLGGEAKNYDENYCHAIATFALAEAYAMQKDPSEYPQIRTAVRRGIKFISLMQNKDGGWRYSRNSSSDMSMFGWQLMALKSAVNAGIPVPEDTRQGMVRFLDSHGQGRNGGLAGYKKGDPPTPAMTAEALFCRQMFSTHANDPASQEAVAYLRQHLPRVTEYDEYFWYYGTLAMRNTDDESWREWNNSLRDLLISLQRKHGALAGSWDPRGKWAGIGGRLYSTALSTMCLEVYYRYQTNPKSTDGQ